jgi:adenosylhomocysteine nucleosidase
MKAQVVVITAVDFEFAAAKSVIRGPTRESLLGSRQVATGLINGTKVAVIRAGWGKANAAGATALAIEEYHPALVLMAGVAGGLQEDSATSGDVVVADGAYQYDLGLVTSNGIETWPPETPTEQPLPFVFATSATLTKVVLDAASSASVSRWVLPVGCECEKDGTPKAGCSRTSAPVDRDHPKVCVATMATGDGFLADSAAAQKLVDKTKAATVDMETAAVAQECANRAVPFVALRVVADVVKNSGESLYYCLKPFSQTRLASVLARVVPAVVVATRQRGPSTEPDLTKYACQPGLTDLGVSNALGSPHRDRSRATLQLR